MIDSGIMTDEEIDEIIGRGKKCVFDFYATWCEPCRMMKPVLEDVSDKYKGKIIFYQIDIDSAEELADRFEITAVPTIVLFDGGKEVARTSGYQEFDEIEKFLKESFKNL